MSVSAPVSFGPIDFPTQQPEQQGDPCSSCGPYVGSNGAWYWILISIIKTGSGSTSFAAWKSNDGGVTRNLVGTIQTNLGEQNSFSDVSYRGSGDIIDMVYQDFDISTGRGNLFTTSFDMASETFSSLSDTGVTHDPTFGQGSSPMDWRVGVNSAGDQVVVYDRTTATVPATLSVVYAVVKHAGVWGSPITISGAVPCATVDQVIRDAAGNLGILWSDNNVAASASIGSFLTLRNNFFYSILDAGGGVTTFTAFANAGGTNSPSYSPFAGLDYGYDDNDQRPGFYDPSTDSIVFPMFKGTYTTVGLPDVATQEIGIIVGTPSAAPVFTYHTVIPSEATGGPSWSAPVVYGRADGSQYAVLFARRDTAFNKLALSTAPSLTGPWTTDLLWYDAQTNPPPDSAIGDSPFSLIMFNNWIRYVDASLVVHTVIEYIVGGQIHDLAMLFPTPITTQTLQLIKTVSGGTASPTDFILSAAGPTPISGAGGVGPSNVDAGTYTLSETTVTDYSLTAIVCVGGTQVGNQLTLIAGQSAVCTFTNTFSGIVPPPPPDTCIIFAPTTPSPSLVAYDEPLELKGS